MNESFLLNQLKFFSGTTDEQRSAIAECAEIKTIEPGVTLFKTGQTALHLYAVLEGEVALSLIATDKIMKPDIVYEEVNRSRFEILEKPILVATVTPGRVFGWSAMVADNHRTLTAETLVRSRLIAFDAEKLHGVIARDPHLGYLLMTRLCNTVSQRLKERTEKLIEAWNEAFGTTSV